MALTLAATPLTTFAATTYSTPAEAVAGITGTEIEDVLAQFQNGKSYGTIADEVGKLQEFQEAMLDIRSAALEQCVIAGTLSREQADAYISSMQDQQALCPVANGNANGMGYGGGYGCGYGRGAGRGAGRGMGRGCGMNNSCIYY